MNFAQILPIVFAALLVSCGSPKLPPLTVTSIAVPMRDGVRLAVDVIRADTNERQSAILIQTRYWRSFAMRFPMPSNQVPVAPRDPIAGDLLKAGYAVVIADVRGTGASEGRWSSPWNDDEVLDAGELVRYIASQPWSDGRVGAYGISYEGTTALLSAVHGGPALRAVLAREIEWNPLDEIIAPGGVLLPGFLRAWDESATALDANLFPPLFPSYAKWLTRGVRPLDTDPNGSLLSNIISRRPPPRVWESVSGGHEAFDRYGSSTVRLGEMGPARFQEALKKTSSVIGLWGGWQDGLTARAALRAWQTLPGPVDIRIGGWDHEGGRRAAPFGKGKANPDAAGQTRWILDFFDHHVRGGAQAERSLRVFVAGEEAWRRLPDWPAPVGMSLVLGGDLKLHDAAKPSAAVELPVAPLPNAGKRSRWHAGLRNEVAYPKRIPGAVAWESAVFAQGLELVGEPTLRLGLGATKGPAAVHAWLSAVSPSGESQHLCEGVHRVGRPGAMRLSPIAARIPPGWKLRLELATADAGSFETLTREVLTVRCDGDSRIEW